MALQSDTSFDIHVGVLLGSSPLAVTTDDDAREVDEDGNVPTAGYRGEHRFESRVARIGQDVLRAAAEAVGREVALVVTGVVSGMDPAGRFNTGSFVVDDLELKFGVKATLGSGKAVEAFLTASGEATVEVTLTLRQSTP